MPLFDQWFACFLIRCNMLKMCVLRPVFDAYVSLA